MKLQILFIAAFLSFAGGLYAQQRSFSYQGMLLDAAKKPVSGEHLITIALYDSPTGSAALHSESFATPVLNGVFSVVVGSQIGLGNSVKFDKQYWLGISVNGGEEMLPRTALTAVPFATHAESASSLSKGATGAVTSLNGATGDLEFKGGPGTFVETEGKTITITSMPIGNQEPQADKVNSIIGTANQILANGTTGTAQFNDVTLTLPQDIHSGATPTFAGMTLSAMPSGTSTDLVISDAGQLKTRTLASFSLATSADLAAEAAARVAGDVLDWHQTDGNMADASSYVGTNNNTSLRLQVRDGQSITNSVILNNNGSIQRFETGDARGMWAVDLQNVRTSADQVASGDYSVIAGGRGNIASGFLSFIGGGGSDGIVYDDISGSNSATSDWSAVVAGWDNRANGNSSFVGGGWSNYANGSESTITGGAANEAEGQYATIGGGLDNTASGYSSTIGGGKFNFAMGDDFTTVSGGFHNTASGNGSSVGGGWENIASGFLSSIGGGASNVASGEYLATIGGGYGNTASGHSSSVGGGGSNTASGDFSAVGGGSVNTASGSRAVVGGGNDNMASGDYSTVSGGWLNNANGGESTIAGGGANQAGGPYASVGGGVDNTASGHSATVGGGSGNVASGEYYATVGGGYSNAASGNISTVSGGYDNTASGQSSTIGGGDGNIASGLGSLISGGYRNTSSGNNSAVGGGHDNEASGDLSTIPGGRGLTLSSSAISSFGILANNADGTRDMTIDAPNTVVFGNANLWLANTDNTPHELRFYEAQSTTGTFPASGTNYTAFKAQSQTADITYILPSSLPASKGAMVTTSGGALSWGSHGRVAAVAGTTQTIGDAAVTATNTILVTVEGTLTTYAITGRTAGTSFTITTGVALATSDVINYQILP